MQIIVPTQFNGVQLAQELRSAKIKLNDYLRLNNDILELDILQKDEIKAKEIIEAHIGVDNSAAIAAQRQAILDRLGLTAEEAQLLLG